MLINLLYVTEDLTRYITPAFVLGMINTCVVRKRHVIGTTQLLGPGSLGFHPKPIISTPLI